MIQSLPNSVLSEKYGISKYRLRYVLSNDFRISPLYRSLLKTYALRVVTGVEFSRAITEGTICRTNEDRNPYNVVYQECNAFTCRRTEKLRLSFREAIPEFGLEAIVIVRIEERKGEYYEAD